MDYLDLTLPLSITWLFAILIWLILILSVPHALRNNIRSIAKKKNSRMWLATICFLIGFIHLTVYQKQFGGNDLFLIATGWIASIKGLALLFIPEVMLFLESDVIAKSISLWVLILMGIWVYLFMNIISLAS